mgnify:CR=1 FL=1
MANSLTNYYYFTEAGNQFGLGHLKRYEAISQMLPEITIELVLYNKSDTNFCDNFWDNDNKDKIKKYISSSQAIFVDTFVADEEVFKIFETANKLVVIDDYIRRPWEKGLIIDWTLDAEKWRENCGDISLFGIKYIATRKSFMCQEWDREVIKKKFIDWKIGTVFGGSDNLNLTDQIYSILKNHKNVSHFGTKLYPSYKKYKDNNRFLWDLEESDFSKKISSCDMVITAGGQMLYELARMGVPSICLSTNDNQDEDFRAFSSNKLIIPFEFRELSSTKFIKKINTLDYSNLLEINERCKFLFSNNNILGDEIKNYLCLYNI